MVDDDAALNQSICAYLNDSGYEAKGCLSAESAYDAMYNSLYEVIISDIMMPGTDGFEFAETVRGLNKTIPILFMSARDDIPSKQRGFDIGIDDYMVKPFDMSELLMRVRALLRRANMEENRKLQVGNLLLDADAVWSHNPDGCHITMEVQQKKDGYWISVEDDGAGVSDEQLERLRNTPHYMMSDSGTEEPRHGLGLLIVQQIVQAHRGSVDFGHSASGGFQVKLHFPF